MNVDLSRTFQLSFVSSPAELPVPAASEILARVRASWPWDEASIVPEQGQFPRIHIAWREDHGFIIHCFEDGESWGDFLVTDLAFSTPAVEINLGGQALERWPAQLFVSERIAKEALEFFLSFGRRNPVQRWIRTDAFPRETVWEGRQQREAWERTHGVK